MQQKQQNYRAKVTYLFLLCMRSIITPCNKRLIWPTIIIIFRIFIHFTHMSRYGKLNIAKYLIERGCSAGCTDNSGRTPLHEACM